MGKTLSPLRYPGGKTKIYNKVKKLIEHNNWQNTTYVEPFAGGFGIGIGLLCDEVVNAVVINDIDSHIYHFWDAVLNQTDELITLIENTEVTIDERAIQKAAYEDYKRLRKENQELQTVKANVDALLRIEQVQEYQQEKENNQEQGR